MVTLSRRTPLSKRQLTFLRAHILKQRRKTKEADVKGKAEVEGPSGIGTEMGKVGGEKKQESPGVDEDGGDKRDNQQPEVPEDISTQIQSLQVKLDSLKDEKHKLFQQLKTVLHEEDEKKRQKEQEQKQQELEKMDVAGELGMGQMDPRLMMCSIGMKRSLPSSPTSIQGGVRPPPSKQHRGPLLPTPDQGSYPRQGTYYRYPPASESGPHHLKGPPLQGGPVTGSGPMPVPVPGQGPRQHFSPRGHMQKPGFNEQRFGHPHPPPHEMHMQGSVGSHDGHMMPHPQMAPHGVGYGQPHPHIHDMQYPGMQMGAFQYTPTPSPYGSMTNLQSPGAQSGQMSMTQFQQLPQQGYVQPHPHEIHMQTQPHPHEIHMHSYPQMQPHGHEPHSHEMHVPGPPHHHDLPRYMTQQSQVMQAQGYGEYPQNISAYGHVHDPRQQKLLMDHRRGTGGGSPVSLQSPLYSSKQDTGALGSPSQSPAYATGERDRRHTSKK